jgi:hypothetical protein
MHFTQRRRRLSRRHPLLWLIVQAGPHRFVRRYLEVHTDSSSVAAPFELPHPLVGKQEIGDDWQSEDADGISNARRSQASSRNLQTATPYRCGVAFVGDVHECRHFSLEL